MKKDIIDLFPRQIRTFILVRKQQIKLLNPFIENIKLFDQGAFVNHY